MKTNKLTSKNISGAGLQVVGGTAGAMLSDGVAGAIPIDNKNIVRAGIAAVSLAALAAIGGNSPTAQLVQGACAGIAIKQSAELVKANVQKALPQPDGTTVNKFLHDAFGSGSVLTAQSSQIQAPGATIDITDFALANPNEQETEETVIDVNSWAMA